MVRTRLKMAATLTVVVLALTGFQTSSSGGGKGGSGKSSKSGGGCSSDKKDNDDYSGSGASGGSGSDYTAEPTATASPTGTLNVTVVDCVKPAQKKRKGKPARRADTSATVRIVSEASFGTTELYKVTLDFKSATGAVVDSRTTTLRVEDGGQKDFEVKMAKPGAVDKVRNCEIRVDDVDAY